MTVRMCALAKTNVTSSSALIRTAVLSQVHRSPRVCISEKRIPIRNFDLEVTIQDLKTEDEPREVMPINLEFTALRFFIYLFNQ